MLQFKRQFIQGSCLGLVLAVLAGGGAMAQALEDPIPAPIPDSSIAVGVETVATGLTAPVWGTMAPGHADRLYIADQAGALWNLDIATGNRVPFGDLSSRLVPLGAFGPGSFDERGLLGLAFHPDYQDNGLLYTFTSQPTDEPADFSTMPAGTAPNHQSVITEWRTTDPADPLSAIDPGSGRELLRIDKPQFNHNGGALNFGPDGMLYVSLGDGGAGDDQGVGHVPGGNAQDTDNILGSILRIDPLGANSENGQYGIPGDNPLVGADGLDEIYAYGLRNPYRFSFDSETGEMFLADAGQNHIEEVDRVTAGGNYGWNIKEGTFLFDPNGEEPGFVFADSPGAPAGLIDPVLQYDHDEGVVAIGGFVYRGSELDELFGKYIFGDYTGRLFVGDLETGLIEELLSSADLGGISILGFGQDAAGELYVLGNLTGVPFDQTGMVLRLVEAQAIPAPHALLLLAPGLLMLAWRLRTARA